MRIKAAIIGALLALGVFGGTQVSAQEVCVSIHVSVTIDGETNDFDLERDAGITCLPPGE